MAANEVLRHKPGTLKQQNKGHKTGRHRSKGQILKECQGRVSVKTLSKKAKAVTRKLDRRNHAQQIRKQKREEILAKKRSRGSAGCPPFLVTVLALSADVDVQAALKVIQTCDETATIVTNDLNNCHISVPRFKQRFTFVTPEYGNLYGMLDAAKVADAMLLLLSPEHGIDDYGEYCLSCLFGQGLPSPVVSVQGLKSLPMKKQVDAKKMLQKHIDRRFFGEKMHNLDTEQDGILVLRSIGSQQIRKLSFRDYRPSLLAEDIQFELDSEESECGTLKISGYLRGRGLSANGLVHLPGWGDFQLKQIDAPEDPFPLETGKKIRANMEVEMSEQEVKVLELADPAKQESLQSENVPDPMEGEQTWPTDEELAQAEAEYKAKKAVMKRVPKGTSEYQAAWIVEDKEEGQDDDEDDEDDDDDDEDMEEEQDMTADDSEDAKEDEEEEDDEEYELISMAGDDDETKYDAMIDIDEEEKMLNKYKDARQDEAFPDEVDTPKDQPARMRFQKYRGLKSFRTTTWDAGENLPLDYARIFQFADFRKTKKRVLAEHVDAGATVGCYVTLHIQNVPRAYMETYKAGDPVVVYGMLPHEQKMSVMHFVVKRYHGNEQPVKSKERMIFHVGYRRFAACPIYSQHTNSRNHKFERFLKTETTMVASVYAPVMFPPASVLMFKEYGSGSHKLIATGSLLSVKPERTIIKRIVLSGHPFKVNRRTAVIRYMFFNREDILWFKPVELRTKYGRCGHIREPLGTHGHMKCMFDQQLTSMDTVLMNLYKRVYPKWQYEPMIRNPAISATSDGMEADDIPSELFD